MRLRIVFALTFATAGLALAGCGQKGPLTLPPAKPTVVTPAVPNVAPASAATVRTAQPATASSGA